MQELNNFKKNNSRLGQGISALVGAEKQKNHFENNDKEKEIVANIDLEKITAGIYQPRQSFDDNLLEELAQSIRENSVIQPIIVRPINEAGDKYEIIAGERRFRASKIAGLDKIPAIIKRVNNHQALEMALIENIQRSELSVIEEAKGFKRLATDFSYTQEQIAKKVGKSRSHVTNLMRLLQLPQTVQNLVDDGLITMGHARALVNSDKAEELADMILEDSLTVRDVENIISNEFKPKKSNKNIANNQNEKILEIEKNISELSNMKAQIKYSDKANNGQIILKFNNIELLTDLVEKLK